MLSLSSQSINHQSSSHHRHSPSLSSSLSSSPTSVSSSLTESGSHLQNLEQHFQHQCSTEPSCLTSRFEYIASASSSRNKPEPKMPRESQRLAEEEARNYYLNKMDDFLANNIDDLCRNMFEMKQKHVELRFEAMDILRKKSKVMANTWKLERDINEHYSMFMARLRKRNSLSNSEA